jgi:hypothetical protein
MVVVHRRSARREGAAFKYFDVVTRGHYAAFLIRLCIRAGDALHSALLQPMLVRIRFPSSRHRDHGAKLDGALYPCIGLKCSRPGVGDEESTHRQKQYE